MNPISNEPSFDELSMTPEARKVLDQYLQRLEQDAQSLSEEDKQELVRDIKEHLYSALESKLKKGKSKQDKLDAQVTMEVLTALGEPQDYLEATSTEDGVRGLTPPRRLTRALEGRLVAGVAQGIANYFYIDVVIVRLLFVFLMFAGGSPLLLYIVMWIIVPEGDPIDITGGANAERPTSTPAGQGSGFWYYAGRLLLAFCVFLLIVGLYFPIALTLVILTFIGFAIPFGWLIFAPELTGVASGISIFGFLTPLLGIAMGFVSLFLLVSFVSLLFRIHLKRYLVRGKSIKLLGIAALLSVCLIVGAFVYAGLTNLSSGEVSEISTFEVGEQVSIVVAEDSLITYITVEGEDEGNEMTVLEIKKARGMTRSQAERNAENITTTYSMDGSRLELDAEVGNRLISHFEEITYEITLPHDLELEVINDVGSIEIVDFGMSEPIVMDGRLISRPAVEIREQLLDVEGEGMANDEELTEEILEPGRRTLLVESRVGYIKLDNVIAGEVQVVNNVGAIEIRDSNFVGIVSNEVGAVEVWSHIGELDITNNVGAISVELEDAYDNEQYKFYTDVGGISLTLPSGLDPYFDLQTDVGGVDNNYVDMSGGSRPEIKIITNVGGVEIR